MDSAGVTDIDYVWTIWGSSKLLYTKEWVTVLAYTPDPNTASE